MNLRCDINGSCLIGGDYIYGILESNSSIRSVEIIGNIKKIPSFCFYNCSELESVSICTKINSIGNSAFYLCVKLKNISIPMSVKSIGYRCFAACTSLEKIILPKFLKKIQESTFFNCNNLNSIVFPKYLDEISNSAFEFCSNLSKIELPENLKRIGAMAFLSCTSLTEIIIPDSVIEIDAYALFGCDNLQRIQLPMSIVANDLFASIVLRYLHNCIIVYKYKRNDTKILPLSYYSNKRVTEIKLNKIIYGTESYDLSENLTTIERYAFYKCENLEKVNLSANIKYIGRNAFMSCPKLSTVIFNCLDISLSLQSFDDSVTFQFPEPVFGYSAYEYSGHYFEELEIPSNITYLPPFCFYSSTFDLLKQNSVKKIGTNCFAKSIILEIDLSGVEILGDCAFAEAQSLERVIFSDSLKIIGKYAFFSCTNLKTLEFNTQHSIELLEGAFYSCNGLDISLILSKIEYIPDYCFYNLQNVQEITIPSNIESIGDFAFSLSLDTNSLIIEEGIKKIGENSFTGLKITSIVFPNSLISIGCSSLLCFSLKYVKFGAQITVIPDNLFFGDSIETVEFTGVVTHYGIGCIFGNQTSTLKVPSNSYFGELILMHNKNIEIVEFGSNCFVAVQFFPGSSPRTLKVVKFGDNTTFIEILKAERYYYIGSEKDDHNIDGSVYKMISDYAEAVFVPSFYTESTFCGKPVVHYSTNEINPKHKINEIKRKLTQKKQHSLRQKRNKLMNVDSISDPRCVNWDIATIDKKQFELLKFNPKSSILSLLTAVF